MRILKTPMCNGIATKHKSTNNINIQSPLEHFILLFYELILNNEQYGLIHLSQIMNEINCDEKQDVKNI